MNNSREALMFFTWLKVGDDGILIELKDKVQAIGIALATDKATLIVSCVVQFHIQYPNVMYCPSNWQLVAVLAKNTLVVVFCWRRGNDTKYILLNIAIS